MVSGARSQFSDGRDTAQKSIQRIELAFQFAVETSEDARSEQFSSRVVMAFSQAARELERAFPVVRAGGLRHLQKGIGDLGHGADHHHRLAGESSFND